MNALPVFIASDPVWAAKFEAAGIPIVGDDIKSQLGATITHRVLARLFEERGLVLDRTYQLNVGGNMDFKNMLERKRLESKKISKTQAVTSNIDVTLPPERDVHIGPSDHIPWLDDRKLAFVRLEGHGFGNAPTSLEYKLEGGTRQLRRGRDRRDPRGEDRPGCRTRRPARGGIRVLHEEPGAAAPGPGRSRTARDHCR